MAFLKDRLYPQLVNHFGDPKPIRELRRKLIPLAQGTVLEIGVGPGANFPHYDAARVIKLYALEPNRRMVELAARRVPPGLAVEFIDLPGERIPLEDRSVDTVVSTFTLCTLEGTPEALHGIRRVLRPEGRLIFVEIGIAADEAVQRWQRRWEPVHRRLFAGLRLTKDIPAAIRDSGFVFEQMESGYLTPFPKSWAHCFWGLAARR
jgi:ubiquinone/menaquinone biosynthesis C-methylase UbiE